MTKKKKPKKNLKIQEGNIVELPEEIAKKNFDYATFYSNDEDSVIVRFHHLKSS